MQVRQFCIEEVVTAHRDTTIRDAALLMRKRHVGALVLVEPAHDGERPVGIVTDRDLVVEVLAQDVAIETLTLEDLIQGDPETIGEHEDIWEAVERMSELGYRRLPVVDERGLLCGILTIDDLIEWFAESMEKLRGLIAREIWHESQTRR